MNALQRVNEVVTMSSREIANLTGKEHFHVIRDAKAMIDLLKKDDPNLDHDENQSFAIVQDSRGYTSEIRLNKELTLCLISGYDARLRLAIIRRLQELEEGNALHDYKIVASTPEGRRILSQLMDQGEKIEEQAKQIEEQKPKADFHDAVTSSVNAQSVQEIAKVLGIGPKKLFDFLRGQGLLMRDNLPYQQYIDTGLFRVVEKQYSDPSGVSRTYTRTLITGKGLAYIHKRLQALTPMLKLPRESGGAPALC